MTPEAKMVISALDILHLACENINYNEACDRCPIRDKCLEDGSTLDAAEELTLTDVVEFIGLSDDIFARNEEVDMDAYFDDLARKIEADEEEIFS